MRFCHSPVSGKLGSVATRHARGAAIKVAVVVVGQPRRHKGGEIENTLLPYGPRHIIPIPHEDEPFQGKRGQQTSNSPLLYIAVHEPSPPDYLDSEPGSDVDQSEVVPPVEPENERLPASLKQENYIPHLHMPYVSRELPDGFSTVNQHLLRGTSINVRDVSYSAQKKTWGPDHGQRLALSGISHNVGVVEEELYSLGKNLLPRHPVIDRDLAR